MSVGLVCLLWMLTAISAGGLGFDAAAREPVPSEGLVASPSTDTDPSSVRPLPFFYDVSTFRADEGGTTVVAAFGVEAGELPSKRVGNGSRYRFSVRMILADTVLRSVTHRHDSVSVDLPSRVHGDHLLCTHLEVQAPPSGNIRQSVFMIDATEVGIGQFYWRYMRIPDYSGSELMVSDVAFGLPDAQTGWERRGATLGLLPTTQLPQLEYDVYYEIYNLPAGNRYTTEIVVEPVASSSGKAAGDRESVRLDFAGESTAGADGTMPELRRVGTSLSEGSYRITVTIEDLNTGKTAGRSRTFEVHSSRRGATVVPAVQVAPLIR